MKGLLANFKGDLFGGISVMDYKGLRAIPSLPKDITLGPLKVSSEVIVMVIVLLLSAFWNLIYAVGIGLVIASLLFMKNGRPYCRRIRHKNTGKGAILDR